MADARIDLPIARDRGSWKGSIQLAVVVILVLCGPVLASTLKEPYILAKATQLVIFAIAAMSLDLVLRPAGLISLGHAAFMGLGAYVVGILLSFDLTSGLLHLLAVIVVCGVIAAAVGAVALKTRGVFFIMITLAFGQMLFYLASSLSRYGGDDGFTIWSRSALGPLDLSNPYTFYFVCAGLLAAAYGFSIMLVRSPFGRVLRGAQENEARAVSLGYDVYTCRLIAFALSGAMAGVAGALLANHTEFVSPSYMGWTRSAEILVMVVLGGMRSTGGAIAGAGFFILVQEGLSELTTHWLGWLGMVIIAVAVWRTGVLKPRRKGDHA